MGPWLGLARHSYVGVNYCRVLSVIAVLSPYSQCYSSGVLPCPHYYCCVLSINIVFSGLLPCSQYYSPVCSVTAMPSMPLPCPQCYCRVLNATAVSSMLLPCPQFYCRVLNITAVFSALSSAIFQSSLSEPVDHILLLLRLRPGWASCTAIDSVR